MGWPNFGSPLLRPLVQGATCTSMEAALLAGREPTSTMSISRHHWQGLYSTARLDAAGDYPARIWSGRGQYGTRDQARPPPSSAFWFHRQKHRSRGADSDGARSQPVRAGGRKRRPSTAGTRWTRREAPHCGPAEGSSKLPDCGAEPARVPVPLQSNRDFPVQIHTTCAGAALRCNRCTMLGCTLDRHCRRATSAAAAN